MYAHGIDIFHIAYDDACIVLVTHDLILEFLPAYNTLFDEHMAYPRSFKPPLCYFKKLFFCICDTSSCASESICGADNKWKTKFTYQRLSFLKCIHRF